MSKQAYLSVPLFGQSENKEKQLYVQNLDYLSRFLYSVDNLPELKTEPAFVFDLKASLLSEKNTRLECQTYLTAYNDDIENKIFIGDDTEDLKKQSNIEKIDTSFVKISVMNNSENPHFKFLVFNNLNQIILESEILIANDFTL